MYYKRFDVRRAITDFATTNGSGGVRECAFYNRLAQGLQRYFADGASRCPVNLGTPAEIDRALASGASAFYCSYWRYLGQDFSDSVGLDLVWATRAKQGGLKFTKAATVWIIEALEEAGVPEPRVKYNGNLGFDLMIPSEMVPRDVWTGGVGVLVRLQESLTSYIASYLREHFPNITVEGVTSPFQIKKGEETCLLSELRVRRGLLLAPMSLCPETGLVSVPVDARRMGQFSILDASKKTTKAFEWAQPRVAYGLLGHVHSWGLLEAQKKSMVA